MTTHNHQIITQQNVLLLDKNHIETKS